MEQGTNRLLQLTVVGTRVSIQNQHGNLPLRWDKTGIVLETGKLEKYLIKVDGCKRKFLRKIIPYAPEAPKEHRNIEPEDKQDDTITNEDSESAGHLPEDQWAAEQDLNTWKTGEGRRTGQMKLTRRERRKEWR